MIVTSEFLFPSKTEHFVIFLPSVEIFSFNVKYGLLLSHCNTLNMCPDQ